MKKLPIRQGDVLLVAVDEIPADAKLQAPEGKKVILAFGEVTGHHHRFEFMDTSHNVKLYKTGYGQRYVHIEEPASLLHEEHRATPPKMTVGRWLIPDQVEYAPAELRRVQD